jgi:hypothetical protein
MKTKLFYFGLTAFLFLFTANAQVGVGNTNPQASLDISASSTTSPANNDGILIPRMSAFPSAPGTTRDGMLIFYTGTAADGKGFYYWNQTTTSWIKIASDGKNTLDEAYDEGGAGAGRIINANDGSVRINGTDGFLVTGTVNSGNTIDSEITGAGTRMFFNPRKAAFRAGRAVGNEWDNSNIGYYSVAFSRGSRASGQYSFAMGFDSGATGNHSFSFGDSSAATGDFSVSLGAVNIASGNSSLAMGLENIASGDNASVFGLNNTSPSFAETTFGLFSSNYTPFNTTAFNLSDRLFTIGNGSSDTNRSNALTIFKSGRMRINDAYAMPLTDGSAGQVMTTDGNGIVSFQDAPGGGTLDDAYDFGGPGVGNTINTTDGSLILQGGTSSLYASSNQTDQGITGLFTNYTVAGSATYTGITGLYQNLTSNATGSFSSVYGIRNRFLGSKGGIAMFNEFQNYTEGANGIHNYYSSGDLNGSFGFKNTQAPAFTINGNYTGYINSIQSSGTGIKTGFNSIIQNTGSGDKYGFRSLISTTSGGTHYGIYSNALKAGSYAGYFLGRVAIGTTTTNNYFLPSSRGTNGQVMTANSAGVVTWETPATYTDTDNQQIDILNLNGTDLEISLQDDGVATQTLDLSSLQDGVGTDNQNIAGSGLSGTNLTIGIENGTSQVINLSSLQDGVGTDNQNIQNLAFNATTNVLTVGIENGGAQTVNLAALDSGGDINNVTAGTGLTGGGTTGSVTLNAFGANGLTTNADDIRLGGNLIENTTITQNAFDLNFGLTSAAGNFTVDTNTLVVESSGDTGFGVTNPEHPVHIVDNAAGEREGIYVDKNDNTTQETNGIYVGKSGSGTGRSHAIRTLNDGTGTGQKYGVFNTISATSAGNQYGTRNFMSGNTTAWQFGTFNNIDNGATGNQYGVYNGMRGASANNLYGVYNEFERAYTSPNDIVGVRNRFTNGTPGTNGMSGVWTDFTTTGNGNFYGVRNEFSNSATGSGNKYGTYNQISGSAGGTHYGSYNSVNVSDGWAGYFLGKNYISQRLSIGETDNADGRLAILNNSGGSNPAHIQLTETSANDGPRIQFANGAETTNEWTLFGRADNTISESSFNFFHTTTGNVMEIKGDGDVEINGQLGVNINNPTYAISLPNSTAIGTGRGLANAWITYSDSRVKSNQQTLANGLSLIEQMTPKTYFHHNGTIEDGVLNLSANGEETLGFIAQELYEILPEAVQKPEDENESLWSVDYNKVIPVTVKAIQELNTKVETLEAENKTLKQQLSKLQQLEARLLALENKSNTANTSETTNTTED